MSTVPPGDDYSRQPVTQIVVQQPSALGRYGKLLLVLLAIAVMVIIGQNASYQSYFSRGEGPPEKYHSLSRRAEDKIAIIKVEGPIFDADGYVKQQIDRVRDDQAVKAVVVRIDSPGGTVTASDYLYHQLRDLAEDRDLPLVVSMGGICASGGYYMAMAVGDAENTIYAEPSTWTGSIGVVIPHYDVSKLLANWNIEDDSIASHKYKLMGSPTRQLSPEEEAEEQKLLQELVDESFERFKNIVLAGRPKLKDNADDLATATTGRIFSADQARALGLVDQIGFLEKAIERAAELAGRDLASLRCVQYEEPLTLSKLLLSADSGLAPANGFARFDAARLLDMTAPRAYYLCTWLPAALSHAK
ncbi:MAG: signal peptide peptidase SppA [Planctomycetota bacterium]|nr:MAG: signal peptide peptidase SppA [Planctomycetota bacterium]